MTTHVNIICLANFRKLNGHCVAGKMFKGKRPGDWLRPVSATPTGELSTENISFQNGDQPKLLDIITVSISEHTPHHYQVENHQIDTDWYWEKKGEIAAKDLHKLQDNATGLWYNGHHSYSGYNDRIPEEVAKEEIRSSLVFIKPQSIAFTVGKEYNKRKIRAEFIYQQETYRLMVTDLDFEKELLQYDDGIYEFPEATLYVTISLGELYHGYCSKLVAAVIRA